MKEPLRDAFFQPANHPYFVKEKSFWTIERVGIQKRADTVGVPSATVSDSLCTSYRASDSGSRTGSVSLSLPPAASSSSQLAPVHDGTATAVAVAALACPTDQCSTNHRLAIRKTASVQPEKGSSSVGLGDGCCFPAPPGALVAGRGSGIVINAATCPNLCRHASFLTDSLNRKNLLGGYFDADYEDGTFGRDVPAGSSRRRRPRRRSDSLRRDSGSVDSILGCEQPNVVLASDRPAGSGRRQCAATASVTSAVAAEVTSAESGSLQPCAATAAELSAVTLAATAVVSAETDATATSVSDCQDMCSICSSSSDGSGNAADVIQPVALKLHLADEVRGDVTKLATSLTRRLFFARSPKHEDVPATQSAALYHRDSDRSHLDVRSQPICHSAEVQRSASVSRCSISVPLAVVQDGVPALSKEQRRASGHTAQASMQLHSKHSDLQPPSRGDASASVTSAGRRLQRTADRASPWMTSASSRVSLELQASTETRFGRNVPRDMVSDGSSSRSSSEGGLFATTVEQMSVDESTGRGERHERKRRRCRRRCCRAVTICVVLAVIGAVVAAVTTLHFEGQLTSSPIARNTSVFDSSATVTATTLSPSKSITITFVGALRLMMEFLPEMADINSTASRNLSKQFCSAVDRIYYNNSDSLVYDPLYGCQVTNLSFGSITVHFALTFLSFGGDFARRNSSQEKAATERVKTIFTEAVNSSRVGSDNQHDVILFLLSDITSLVLRQISNVHADNIFRSASVTENQEISTFESSPSTAPSLPKDEPASIHAQPTYPSSTACDCPMKIGNAVLGSVAVPLLSDSTFHVTPTSESTDSTTEFRLSTSSASQQVNSVELLRSSQLPNRGTFPTLTPLLPLAMLTGKLSVDSIRASASLSIGSETLYRQPTHNTAKVVTLRPATAAATPAVIVVSLRSISAATTIAVPPALSTTAGGAGSRSGLLLTSELDKRNELLFTASQPAAGTSSTASFSIADDRVPGSTYVTLPLQQPALSSPFPCEVPLEYANCLFYMQCNGTDRYCSAASVTSAYVGAVATNSCAGPVLCCPGQKFYYNAFTGLCEKCCHFSKQEAEPESKRSDCVTDHDAAYRDCIWECVPDTCLLSGLAAVGHDDGSNSNNNHNNEQK